MHFFKKPLLLFLFSFGCFIFIGGCTTKKNTIVTRAFHNLTSRFNGFFYATESVKEGVVKIEQAHKDDYTKILPVFIYATPTEAKSIYPEMDKAIKKSSLVIQHHTITDKKGEEIPGAVKWIDDNYLLIGKAHFYKHDYFSALESFDYVSKEYKKQKIRYNAMFWMIRTYNEMGSFSQAEPLITLLNNDKKLPKDLIAEFMAVSADYYIQQGNYHNAIKPLANAVSHTKKKKDRIRYSYILAQLYQKDEDAKKASKYYDMVVKMNPPYEMAFNARLNRAKLFDINSKKGKEIKEELLKMCKDEKNTEYLDQLYYVLAEIAEKENDITTTIDYLKLSVRSSVSNNIQKSLSYLKLADISFGDAKYKLASAYYDSTMAFLAKDYPKYDVIADRKKSLASLVKHLNIVEREDSLQALAKMSEADRDEVIEGIITNIEKEEKKKAEEKAIAQEEESNDLFFNQNTPTQNMSPQQTGGMWYFYNPSAISFGVSEFTKKWGTRQREDNWRRTNKESVMAVQEDEIEQAPINRAIDGPVKDIIEGPKTPKDLKSKDYYLKDIPLTEAQLKKSHDNIIDAQYNIGTIYKEQLQNNIKSAEAFEELLKRYKDNKYKLSVYYQLYRLYLAIGDETRATIYKDILLKNYPDSEYAKLITTPDSKRGTIADLNEIEQFYTATYQAYTEGKYSEVINRCTTADSIYSKNALMPKFDYLKALSIGRTGDFNAFELALAQVVVKYPKDEVKKSAQEILDVIKSRKNPSVQPAAPTDSTTSAKEKYQLNDSTDYFYVIVIPNKKGNIAAFKTALSDFNNKSYSISNLTINATFLDTAKQMISVMKFAGKDKGMNYYDFLNESKEVFKDIENLEYQTFIISSANFKIFYQEKDLEGYLSFFRRKILQE